MKVHAAMSMPRLTFSANFSCALAGCLSCGIEMSTASGAYWSQALEECMVGVLKGAKPDAILVLDYDTVFSPASLKEILRLFDTHRAVDALAAIQSHRGRPAPMLQAVGVDDRPRKDVYRAEFSCEMTRVVSAHFGLTLLRAEALGGLGHPWFRAEPGKDGRWRKDRTDADAWFWQRWAEAGHNVFSANHVPIGHGDFMIRWRGQHWQPVYQSFGDYTRNGPPAGAWE